MRELLLVLCAISLALAVHVDKQYVLQAENSDKITFVPKPQEQFVSQPQAQAEAAPEPDAEPRFAERPRRRVVDEPSYFAQHPRLKIGKVQPQRRPPRPLSSADSQCVFCQYFVQRLQNDFYASVPGYSPATTTTILMTPYSVGGGMMRLRDPSFGRFGAGGAANFPPPPSAKAASVLMIQTGASAKQGTHVLAKVGSDWLQAEMRDVQSSAAETERGEIDDLAGKQEWERARFLEPNQVDASITSRPLTSPSLHIPSTPAGQAHILNDHAEPRMVEQLPSHVTLLELGQKTQRQLEAEKQAAEQRRADWITAQVKEPGDDQGDSDGDVTAASRSASPSSRVHWMRAELLEVNEKLSHHVAQFMPAQLLEEGSYTQQRKHQQLLRAQNANGFVDATLVEVDAKENLNKKAHGAEIEGRRQTAMDMRTSRPPQMRYDNLAQLSRIDPATYSQCAKYTYGKMELMCSRRLPNEFAGYCSALLAKFMRIASGLNYGERPDEVCMRLDFCGPTSYLHLSPHAVLQ